ncbi:MAG: hypothetical protein JSW04_02635 [Desulfobacterales bacterium]|nr:MAG: hypothetical protein JSV38_10080 [Desulfobacterales bacterium]UCD90352.1 MAG: hypothetical protein JSW04_02635 [Desulfobacterales bacterium]
MKKSFNVQNELQETYRNLVNLIPDSLKNDPHTQKIILVYLKLGGEKLARQGIEIIKNQLLKEHLNQSDEAREADESLSEKVDMTEPHPHELGGFEFPSE